MTAKFQHGGQMSRRKNRTRKSIVERQTHLDIELRMLALLELKRRRLLRELDEVVGYHQQLSREIALQSYRFLEGSEMKRHNPRRRSASNGGMICCSEDNQITDGTELVPKILRVGYRLQTKPRRHR
jgi:hypothetical protein